jgi:alpha-tubulin suppressor-like RCC1 family protein
VLVPGIDPLNPAMEITSGSEHTCARLADGSVACWGSNTSSQLGATVAGSCLPGNPGSCSMKPVTVTTSADQAFSAVHVVSGSGVHTCAIAPNSAVWCWGDNTYGQLGDGMIASSVHPVRVVGL